MSYASSPVPRKPKTFDQRLELRHSRLQRTRWERAAQIGERDLSDWVRRTLDREATAMLDRKAGKLEGEGGER